MGYYTNFELEIVDKDMNPINASDIIQEIQNEYKIGFGSDSTKWYTYQEDMKKVSLKYPEYIFVLSGSGEEFDDIWKEYFYKGENQFTRAKIEFEEFNLLKKQKEKEELQKLKKELKIILAPITPDNYSIEKWKKDKNQSNRIIGTWSEDGLEYEITCPPQIRNCIIAMQNNLRLLLKDL